MSRVPADVRDQVRERAGGRCEYCRKPEGAGGSHPYHVDHIIALRHGGSDALSNLAWACFHCNTGKGSDLASFDAETQAVALLYNPQTQRWEDHFALSGALIVGLTASGRVTVRLLGMNSANQVEIRQRLINAGEWPP